MFTFPEELRAVGVRERFTAEYPVSESLTRQLISLQEDPSLFAETDFKAYELEELYHYLKASHRYYLDRWLPKIGQTLRQLRLKSPNESLTLNLLSFFLDKYNSELENHIRYEEQVLLRFVEDMLQGIYNEEKKNFVLQHFLFTHNDHIILHLEQLREEMIKLDVELQSNLIFNVLFNQLQILQVDLVIHNRIEDEIFIPKLLRVIHTRFGGAESDLQ
jgi:regulator of cell morphogenesis and NO signaling